MRKRWIVAQPISNEFKSRFMELDPVVLQLLVNRGVTSQEVIHEFLNPDWHEHINDPFLFQDMAKAVERIFQSIEKQEKVVIFGDYDADGICGTAILYTTLKRIGFNKIDIYIPHRESEGYGLNLEAVDKIKKAGTDLIITVDLGVSNIEQVKKVRELGMDIIITDHHELKLNDKGEIILPSANAIIHTRIPDDNYPFKHLSGTGTAFKLAQALLDQTLEETEAFEKWLLDLTAIGTIADVVPLLGENRTLVKYGMMVLNKTQRIGLRELIKTARINNDFNLDSWNIAWQITPRINAAGRISHAQEALELILTENKTEAQALASHLNKINNERQQITDKIYEEAKKQIDETANKKYLLSAYKSNWPLGVVGLVAGKLADKYHRPVILMTEVDGTIKGSGRSIPEFHLVKGLDKVKDFLSNFGGHGGACGFSLEKNKFKAFLKAFENVVSDKLKDKDLQPSLNIDLELNFADINWDMAEAVEKFRPFGEGNPMPLFLSKKLTVKQIDTVGSNGQHLKLSVCDEKEQNVCKTIGFGMSNGWAKQLKINEKIDIVFELGFNEWNGQRELQVKLVDLRKSFP